MDKINFSGFSLPILGILLHFNLGGFSFHVSFSKRAFQIFERNLRCLKSVVVANECTPQSKGMNTVKWNSERRIPRKVQRIETFSPSKSDLSTGVISA